MKNMYKVTFSYAAVAIGLMTALHYGPRAIYNKGFRESRGISDIESDFNKKSKKKKPKRRRKRR